MAAWTATQVKTYYPDFAAVADGTVDVYIARAAAEIFDDNWQEDQLPFAGMALTAHFMALNGLGAAGAPPGGIGGAGGVSSMSVGGVSISYDTSGSASASAAGYAPDLMRTRYGMDYLRLSKLQLQSVAIL